MIGLVLARNRVLGCSWSIVVGYRVMREGFWLLSIDIALRVPIHTNPKANAANPRSHKFWQKTGSLKGKTGKTSALFPEQKVWVKSASRICSYFLSLSPDCFFLGFWIANLNRRSSGGDSYTVYRATDGINLVVVTCRKEVTL
jgi:hypothetical protein